MKRLYGKKDIQNRTNEENMVSNYRLKFCFDETQ